MGFLVRIQCLFIAFSLAILSNVIAIPTKKLESTDSDYDSESFENYKGPIYPVYLGRPSTFSPPSTPTRSPSGADINENSPRPLTSLPNDILEKISQQLPLADRVKLFAASEGLNRDPKFPKTTLNPYRTSTISDFMSISKSACASEPNLASLYTSLVKEPTASGRGRALGVVHPSASASPFVLRASDELNEDNDAYTKSLLKSHRQNLHLKDTHTLYINVTTIPSLSCYSTILEHLYLFPHITQIEIVSFWPLSELNGQFNILSAFLQDLHRIPLPPHHVDLDSFFTTEQSAQFRQLLRQVDGYLTEFIATLGNSLAVSPHVKSLVISGLANFEYLAPSQYFLYQKVFGTLLTVISSGTASHAAPNISPRSSHIEHLAIYQRTPYGGVVLHDSMHRLWAGIASFIGNSPNLKSFKMVMDSCPFTTEQDAELFSFIEKAIAKSATLTSIDISYDAREASRRDERESRGCGMLTRHGIIGGIQASVVKHSGRRSPIRHLRVIDTSTQAVLSTQAMAVLCDGESYLQSLTVATKLMSREMSNIFSQCLAKRSRKPSRLEKLDLVINLDGKHIYTNPSQDSFTPRLLPTFIDASQEIIKALSESSQNGMFPNLQSLLIPIAAHETISYNALHGLLKSVSNHLTEFSLQAISSSAYSTISVSSLPRKTMSLKNYTQSIETNFIELLETLKSRNPDGTPVFKSLTSLGITEYPFSIRASEEFYMFAKSSIGQQLQRVFLDAPSAIASELAPTAVRNSDVREYLEKQERGHGYLVQGMIAMENLKEWVLGDEVMFWYSKLKMMVERAWGSRKWEFVNGFLNAKAFGQWWNDVEYDGYF